MNDRNQLRQIAIDLCIPALEKAINNLVLKKPYVVTDHVGYELTKLEELLRPLWGIAAVLKEQPRHFEITLGTERVDLCEQIRKIMLQGTDTNSDICFSRFAGKNDENAFANQVITEIAGYMIAVLIAPDALWNPYTKKEKDRVAAWVQYWAVKALKHSWPNNHYWFPMLSVAAIEKLGYDCGDIEEDMAKGFEMLESMYMSNGWYMDGEFGRFDYYMAWSHNFYPALWVLVLENTRFFDANRKTVYMDRIKEFIKYYIHIFDCDGAMVAFGRSLSYRFAASSVFAVAGILGCDVDYGLIRTALMKNIRYFMANVIPSSDSIFPPGYLYQSTALVENYTSGGGAYWCSKVFLALLLDADHAFWKAPPAKLPIETGDFIICSLPDNINMVLEGAADTSGVTLYNNTSTYFQKVFTHKFNDMASYYSKFVYNSRSGFGISSPDKVSLDNMISVGTADGTMESVRKGFKDLGYKNGILISEHTPFSNDAGTVVKSWIIPLGNGFHIRAHKVTLAQEYYVKEGGFSVGYYNDNNESFIGRECSFSNANGCKSSLYTVSSVPFAYKIDRHQPGNHILAPQSAYPVYKTEVLKPGVYYFVTTFFFTTGTADDIKPEVQLDGSTVKISYGKRSMTINIS